MNLAIASGEKSFDAHPPKVNKDTGKIYFSSSTPTETSIGLFFFTQLAMVRNSQASASANTWPSGKLFSLSCTQLNMHLCPGVCHSCYCLPGIGFALHFLLIRHSVSHWLTIDFTGCGEEKHPRASTQHSIGLRMEFVSLLIRERSTSINHLHPLSLSLSLSLSLPKIFALEMDVWPQDSVGQIKRKKSTRRASFAPRSSPTWKFHPHPHHPSVSRHTGSTNLDVSFQKFQKFPSRQWEVDIKLQ